MFIDIHVHTRRIPGPPRADGGCFATPEELIKQYDELGIEAAVLLPGVTPECEFEPQSVMEVLEICQLHPGRFVPFCNIDPRWMTNSPTAPLGEIMSFYKARGCRGIGELTVNLPFTHPMIANLFKHAQDTGLPVTFHISPEIGNNYGLYDEPGLPQLEQTLQAFPALKFLGHSQAFWAEIGPLKTARDRWGYPTGPVESDGRVSQLMRKYPNLLGDLSAGSGHNALARDENFALRFLDEFQDRLFFGTDICRPFQHVPQVEFFLRLRDDGKLSPAIFNKIARENAARLLGL